MKTTKYSLIVLLVAGATLSTYAQEDAQRPSKADREAHRAEMIVQFDTDGDGVLSREERKVAREARQADGEERRAPRAEAQEEDGEGRHGPRVEGRQGQDRKEQDRNGRGRGDVSEDRKTKILAKFDIDGDGTLSEEERALAREARREIRMIRGERAGKGQDRVGMKDEPQANALEMFDIDGDSKLSSAERAAMKAYAQAKKEEWKAKSLEKFDIDGDGELSSAEHAALKAYTQAKQAERKNAE
jgi:Ca2+-binding EF-hand superfamily protein